MLSTIALAGALASLALPASASPVRRWDTKSYYELFDLQGHRGTRGAIVER